MVSRRHWLAWTAIGLLAGGCQILSYTFVTPASVAPGGLFTMRLTGVTNGTYGLAGVVLQVPNGFKVLGASVFATTQTLMPLTRDAPRLLDLYTPDPNHYLASFSAASINIPTPTIRVDLKIYMQAPTTPGAYQVKMALAAQLTVSSPFTPQLALASFQTPGASVVRALQVTTTPAPPPFALGAVLFGAPADLFDLEAADIDGDGRDDLVQVVRSGVTWRRSVAGGFAPAAVVLPPSALLSDSAVADFDGDGFQDIALAAGQVLFGDGGTTWKAVSAGTASGISVGAGDVDGDGLADLAWSGNTTFTVLRGQSNRTFVPWNTGLAATSPVATSIDVVDLDADGRAELILAGYATPPRVYRSTVGGVWSLVGSMAPALGDVILIDVNGDGRRDLLPSGAGQWYGYTPSALQAMGTVPVTTFNAGVALDFDRDGREDFAIVDNGPFVLPPQPGRIELWRNTVSGFQAMPLPTATGFEVQPSQLPHRLWTADFDDDTFPDLCAMTDGLLAWHNTRQGVAPFGEPCAAPGSAAPDLTVIGSVAPGQSALLQLANATPLGGALLWLGSSRTLWNAQPVLPLDLGTFGASGCTLLAEPLAIVGAIANGSGVASLPFTVPPLPPTAAVVMFVQGATMVPAANPLGAVFSRGLALKIQ